jgi:hypothetical protein
LNAHIQTLNSLLTIYTDASRKITQHIEEWDHQRDTTREDDFFGMLNDYRRKATASVIDAFVSKDPPKTS